jgi:hypothetical protein
LLSQPLAMTYCRTESDIGERLIAVRYVEINDVAKQDS